MSGGSGATAAGGPRAAAGARAQERSSSRRPGGIARALWIGALGVALAGGAALRFVGIGWGLPYNLHIDEKSGIFHPAIEMEWRWHRQGWPDLRNPVYGALPALGFVTVKDLFLGGEKAARQALRTESPEQYLASAYSHDPGADDGYFWPDVTRLVRGVSALCYCAALALTILCAARLWGAGTAAVAGLAVAGVPALVQHAHYYTGEAFIVLGGAVLFLACLRIAASDLRRDHLVAALGLVLMLNGKPTLAIFVPFVVLAAWTHQRRVRGLGRGPAARALLDSGRLWMGQVAWAAGWLATNPSATLRLGWWFGAETDSSLLQHLRAYAYGALWPEWTWFYDGRPRSYFATQTLLDALGAPLALLVWVGVAWVLLAERGPRRWPALFGLLGLVTLAFTPIHTIRYLVPSLPWLVLCAARLSVVATASAAALFQAGAPASRRLGAALGGALGLATAASFACAWFIAAAISNMGTQPDNRVAAARWLWSHARPGERILVGDLPEYRPPLLDQHHVGSEPRTPRLTVDCLFCRQDRVQIRDDVRFIVVDGWELRMPDVPRYRRLRPGRTRFLEEIRARGAPEGFRLAARFDNRPNLLGWQRDETHSEILYVAFDHLPLLVFERLGEGDATPR
jgi:hypothetical protein